VASVGQALVALFIHTAAELLFLAARWLLWQTPVNRAIAPDMPGVARTDALPSGRRFNNVVRNCHFMREFADPASK